ncbi:epoxyqueuosine reductase QueH [bacterium]|nr:epoxyqueuosine reductase QueH [bacterium]
MLKKVLVHICCAPCFLYPRAALLKEGYQVLGLFYNPNIQPYSEYQKRLQTVQELEKTGGMRIIYRDSYDLDEFLRGVAFREEKRCLHCYYMRLKETAIVARRGEFTCFTSTLLYSKYQDHESIRRIGTSLADKYGIPFLYRDFRSGWKEGIERSKTLSLYRQGYCGCIYSERDRYLGYKRPKQNKRIITEDKGMENEKTA